MSDYDASKLCPQHEHCGGCIYQGVPYDEQYAQKDKSIRRLKFKVKAFAFFQTNIDDAIERLWTKYLKSLTL